MAGRSLTPPNNIRRFRLDTFVGRQAELARLAAWVQESPILAITGPSGIGKSSLATALAYQLMSQFEEGLIWVTAFGAHEFRIYDVIRAIEDVLATGITSRPPDQWQILALQQLYGRRRLIVLDEIAQTEEATAQQIAESLGRIGPGGPGRAILVGRDLPQPLLELVGDYCLHLGGLTETEASELLVQAYPSSPVAEDLQVLMEISQGHPLALKLLAPIWTIVDVVLADWEKSDPAAVQLLTRFTLSSGGSDFDALEAVYWRGLGPTEALQPTLVELTRHGLLQYDADEERYLLHPALRRLLINKNFAAIPHDQQRDLADDHARYYLSIARQYERVPANQWSPIEGDWANIRQGAQWLTQQLEDMAGDSVEDLLLAIDGLNYFDSRRSDQLSLLSDYALALRTYCVERQPPRGFRWLAAGLVASQVLGDSWSRTLIGGRLSTLAYLQGDYDLAETWLRRSLNALVPLNDRARLSRIWSDLGALYKAQGRFEEALAACQQVHSLNEGLGNWRGMGSALMRIGSIYYGSEDIDSALDWHKRALKLFEEHDDLGGQAMAHNNVGLAYEAEGDFEQAIHHYRESARRHESLNNTQGLVTAYGNLGSASYELGDFEAAIEWYRKDLALSEQIGDWTGTAATLHNIGHVALEMEDLDAAHDYFTRSRDLYAQFGLNEFADEEELLIQIVQERRATRG
jgi:tetratricopeptide (TPR) repeat protein/energy-coupling factor transporter ATP-binding protein EcfA2